MNFTVENVNSVKKRISFEIPAERVDSEYEKVFQKVAKNAALKGFRKGKVPRPVVEKYFSERIADEVLRNLVGETCYRTLYENSIMPVGVPEIEGGEVVRGEPLKYAAVVEVVPEIDPSGYKGLKLRKEAFTSDPTVIDGRLEQMRQGMAQLKPAAEGKEVGDGDFVTIDFTGFLDGVAFENGAAEDYQLEIGSGQFVPGFEEQLKGMKEGEAREIAVTFPEAYGNSDLAGKDVTFQILLKGIKVKEVPPLDDDFARECGDFDSLAELRAKMTEIYEKQEQERVASDLRDALVTALIEANPIDVPEVLVEKQLASMMESAKRRLAMQKLSFEMVGMDEQGFRARYSDTAKKRVQGMLLMDAVAKKENLSVDNAELESRFEIMAGQSGDDPAKVKAYYQGNAEALGSLRMMIMEEKAVDLMLESAEVTEVPAEALKEEK